MCNLSRGHNPQVQSCCFIWLPLCAEAFREVKKSWGSLWACPSTQPRFGDPFMASNIPMQAQVPCSQQMDTVHSSVLRPIGCFPSPSILLVWHRCLLQAHRKHRLRLAAAKRKPFFLMRLGSRESLLLPQLTAQSQS